MSMSKRIAAAVFTSALVLVPLSSPASAAEKTSVVKIEKTKVDKPSGGLTPLRIDWY